MGEVRALTTLFNLLDGNQKEFEVIQDAFEKLYDRDVIMEIEGEDIDYERIMDAYVAFAEEGVRIDILSIQKKDYGVDYEAAIYYPEGDVFYPKTKATFKGGKVVHVAPQDPAQIEDLIDQKFEQ